MIPNEYVVREHRRDLMREAEQHRLARSAQGERQTPTLRALFTNTISRFGAAISTRRLAAQAGSDVVISAVPCCECAA